MDFARITRNLEEMLTEEELRGALDSGKKLKHYIGFEISGKIHLGTGLLSMGKIKDFMDVGVDSTGSPQIETTIFLADWHTFINEKLGGADMETIRRVAVGYFKEGMKASFRCVGGDPEKLNFVLGSDLYAGTRDYWQTVIRVGKETTLSRAKRSVDIMGRSANEEMPTATLFYPMMQAADIFALGVDIAHAGTDQRKVHVVARDVAPALGKVKPIAVHHHLLMGLGKPPVWPIPEDARKSKRFSGPERKRGMERRREAVALTTKGRMRSGTDEGANATEDQEREMMIAMKMSKSKPRSAVFIHDTPEEIREKIQKAFCPPGEVMYNPILDWVKHAIFLGGEGELHIPRSEENGDDMTVRSEELPKLYKEGAVHPQDLKNAVAERLIEMLEPARNHFASGAPKEMLEDLEKLMQLPR